MPPLLEQLNDEGQEETNDLPMKDSPQPPAATVESA